MSDTLHSSGWVGHRSQCSYLDDDATKAAYNLSERDWLAGVSSHEPSVAVFLDSNMEWLGQSTVYVELDADFGIGKRNGGVVGVTRMQQLASEDNAGYRFAHVAKQLEDIRAFVRRQGREIWICYYGPDYGYTGRLGINRVHFDEFPGGTVRVYIKASEVQMICCGRNVAIFSDIDNDELKGVSWVDPLTVQSIDPGVPLRSATSVEGNMSHIHGTSNVMVHLPGTSELLGVAHFHRPQETPKHCARQIHTDREGQCKYAPYGHHHTHALYTMSDRAPHVLMRLSNEFVFPRLDRYERERKDPHIIQFASGLAKVGDSLLISYGINDCESAVMWLQLGRLDELLIEVEPGQEVKDLMRKLSSNITYNEQVMLGMLI
jgi:hypothetical protein